MKIAVLADIHSNYIALKACLEHAGKHGVDQFIFLGDYIGEAGCPQKTMDMIYELQEKYPSYFVKGNKEDCWLGFVKDEGSWLKYGDSITGTLLYQYERRREQEQKFFEELSIAQKVVIEGYPAITICHGSPVHSNQSMRENEEETQKVMEACDTDIILFGHTHRRRVIEHNSKIAYNPGSVGAPLESDGKAQYMILQGKQGVWQVEYQDVEYNVEEAIGLMHQEGLDKYAPCWCKITEALLRTGDISHGSVLRRAMELCYQETGACNWPDIPEKYMVISFQEQIQQKK